MPQKLIEGYNRFRKGYYAQNRDRLQTLAQGQSPRIALVSCCDSRVDPSVVFDASPGELFVVRNVANLVPPYEDGGLFHGTSAALEFAVTGLNVSDIVVLGHAQCGGIAALMDKPSGAENNSFIDHWMSLAEPARKAALAGQAETGQAENRYQACEHSAIELSLQNLMTFPFIKSRVDQGVLSIHGWYYDLAESTLSQFSAPAKVFVSLTGDAS